MGMVVSLPLKYSIDHMLGVVIMEMVVQQEQEDLGHGEASIKIFYHPLTVFGILL